MQSLGRCALLITPWVALAACADASVPDAAGPAVAIAVAPLSLSGVTDAEYTLTVWNAADAGGEVVWSRSGLTSQAYGDGGGSLAYVGPCDASTGTNSVELELTALYEGSGVLVDATSYRNPTPIVRNVVCAANSDTRVSFDMTLVRAARQGFFDVAVSFDDIYCSAKLDCRRDSDGDGDIDLQDGYIALLHDASGQRGDTAILALACTAGPGQDTHLYMSDVAVTCGTTSHLIAPSAGVGNLAGIAGAVTPPLPDADLFQAAVYRGAEQLTAPSGSYEKRYWNIAIGLTDPSGCTLSATATASDGPLTGGATPADTTYPVITFDTDLATCTHHAIDTDGVVATSYTPPSGATFAHWYDGATALPVCIPTTCGPTLSCISTNDGCGHPLECPCEPADGRMNAMVAEADFGVVMYGGRAGSARLVDGVTYLIDSGVFSRLPVSGPAPPRYNSAMGFDPIAGQVLVFGGTNDGFASFDETWELSGGSWTKLSPTTHPTAGNYNSVMVWDAASEALTLFGGGSGNTAGNDTWVWDRLNQRWSLLSPAVRPSARSQFAAAYDAARGQMVLFSGAGATADTWLWDGVAGTWTAATPAHSPPPRSNHAMAYDGERQRVVLFGGYNGTALSDTWTWDGSDWTQETPSTAPSRRSSHMMFYDAGSKTVVVYGGWYNGIRTDAWAWDGSGWTQLTL